MAFLWNIRTIVSLVSISFILQNCTEKPAQQTNNQSLVTLEKVATSQKQWTGLAMSADQRLFVNFPRWSEDATTSVGEWVNGAVVPYPNSAWNQYGIPASDSSFVCVQSVFVDAQNRLWILDPANPYMEGVVPRGPRLFQFDLTTDQVQKVYAFPDSLIEENTYLNDVRIDVRRDKAYITDSGNGGLFVVDLDSGSVMLRLENHFSTKAETDHLDIGPYQWKGKVHSDGIALSNDGQYLYYAALSGHSLYRVPVDVLIDPQKSERDVGDQVTESEEIVATDGMLFGPTNTLYMGGLEENAIYVWKEDNPYHSIISDDRIRWADSFTAGPDGKIYFTTSQIHIPVSEREPYAIYRMD